MAFGERIRAARKARGWTQRRLAEEAKLSQPFVSAVERGRVGRTAQVDALLRVLGLDPEGPAREEPEPDHAAIDAALQWNAPLPPLNLPVSLKVHRQPEVSGDFFVFLPLPRNQLLVVAADVAGNGRTAAPAAIYLQGWLRGCVSTWTAAPRLESLAQSLIEELDAVHSDAAFFLALLGPHPALHHAIRYTGLSLGYPAPILLTGGRMRTAPSAGSITRDGRGEPVGPTTIEAPWSLVMASDGLLRRLGAGAEDAGKNALLRWQSGVRRGERPERYLASGAASREDEALAIMRWESWDQDFHFNLLDDAEVDRVAATVERAAEAAVGAGGAAAIRVALAEALDNAHVHGYQGGGGYVHVRHRTEDTRFRVEVEDEGIGTVKPGDGLGLMEHWQCTIEHFSRIPTGTCISISYTADPKGRRP